MQRRLLPLVAALSLLPFQALAVDWRENQLILPEKVTVGPADNYQAQVDNSEERLFFTRHRNLVSQIVQQNLTTGNTRQLLPPDHDAKDPALAPDGRYLAMTSYRNNALGSVCLLPLQPTNKRSGINCLTPAGQSAWLPFWVDNQTLGYLRRPLGTNTRELVLQGLNGSERVVAEGSLSAPAASPDGRYLVYQRRDPGREGLHIYDLEQNQENGPLPIDLPGISSYARIHPSDGHLYFSHFLNDTSGDQQIDAEDHSVVFRIPLQPLLETSAPLLPEQLTSVAQNCNFPALGTEHLYVTCAYEGSLDTYRLPFSGQLPTHWQNEDLWEAEATASRYAERLLVLNNLRYRQQQTSVSMLKRLLANHLEMQELTAAGYYTAQLLEKIPQNSEETLFFQHLEHLLQLQALARLQPPGQLTPAFRQELNAFASRLQASADAGLSQLFLGWTYWLGQENTSARQALEQASTSNLPLAAYLQSELQLKLASNSQQRLKALLAAAQNPVLTPDGRLYYAFNYLQELTRQGEGQLPSLDQLSRLQQQLPDTRLQELVANEIDLVRLTLTQDRAEQRPLYQAIIGRLKASSDQALMHRASHIRAIQLMALAEEFSFMELMSRHWLTSTPIEQVSFAAAAEQYAYINLDRAYGAWSQGDENTALNTFYSVLRQTSNLEALYNLLVLGLDPEADPALKERMQRLYDQLEAEELLGNNSLYAQALRPLLENHPASQEQLQAAANRLQQLEITGLDSGVRDLLLGSIYHRQLKASQQGYSLDSDLAQKAHYHYMLGLDLAFAHPRIQVSLLENLGQLHFQLGNHGLAADFFAQRLQGPWLNEEQKLWTHWRLARSYYYSNRYPEAAEQAQLALELGRELDSSDITALHERAAFYALQAQDFTQAVELYDELLAGDTLDSNNQAKAIFARAFSLYRLGENQAAQAGFQHLLELLPRTGRIPAHEDRLANFEPRRLEMQAYGFLAQLTDTPEEKLDWLSRRINLLEQMQSEDRRYSLQEADRIALIMKAWLQKAALQEASGQLDALAASVQAALASSKKYQQAGGALGSQPLLQTLYTSLTLGGDHPQQLASLNQQLQPLLQATLDELEVEGFMPPVNHYQRLKLQLLNLFFQAGRTAMPGTEVESQLQQLQNSQAWQGLQATRPDLQQELQEILRGVRLRLQG
ncbi:PD40 domain-containing protein [Marinospirillum perlucidum]|uniref:PD40 domain-containing protein n=1 Tax=Marinospirillum perlucidum TaxID=1982602 RepID=UPI000DF3D234|nr:PD40 domain-containing protein [Marinospirillum perlucidum]